MSNAHVDPLKWERVHVFSNYHHRPRLGVADYQGSPHIFEAEFDEAIDYYSGRFFLVPIEPDLLALVLERDGFRRRKPSDAEKPLAGDELLASLQSDRRRYLVLSELIGDRYHAPPERALVVRATFRGPLDGQFEVSWRDPASAREEPPNWERVHVISNYHDCPRLGVADYQGSPHIFESEFDEAIDDYSERFCLVPIEPDLFALVLESHEIWQRKPSDYDKPSAGAEPRPTPESDQRRRLVLRGLIGDRLHAPPDRSLVKKAIFWRIPDREFKVSWRDFAAESWA